VLVYAGCVHWPFHWDQKVGITVAAVILVLGGIDAVRAALK